MYCREYAAAVVCTSVRHDAAGVEVGQQPALQLPLSRRRRGPGHALGGAARAAVVARSLWSRGGSLYVEVSDDDRKVLQATFFSIVSLFLKQNIEKRPQFDKTGSGQT
jgi:hypothetical protein